MKASSISTLKKELASLPAGDVLEICLRLARYKKENKELLSYLLFDANNEPEYISSVKDEMDHQFAEINLGHLYFAKKSIRKILKLEPAVIPVACIAIGHPAETKEVRTRFNAEFVRYEL